jgi:hypothetical protein
MRLSRLLLPAMLLIVAGCQRNEEILSGQYYDIAGKDSVAAVVAGNTIHILVIQAPVTTRYIDPLSVRISQDPGLLDTVKLRLDVMYGGYSLVYRNPARIVRVQQDSVILWYAGATYLAPQEVHGRTVSAVNDPKPESYQIVGVEIVMAPGRTATVASTLIW